MWRDILTVILAIITVLTWFGITPGGITRLAKQYITLVARLSVLLLAIVTVCGIFAPIFIPLYRGGTIYWGFVAAFLYLYFLAWQPIFTNYLSQRGSLRKVISLANLFGVIPVLALLWIDWDVPLWRKAVPMLSGFAGGLTFRFVVSYALRKLAAWRSRRHKVSS